VVVQGLVVATPVIINDIVAEVEDLLQGITVANGFDYDFGTINDPTCSDPIYPSAEIIQGDEQALPAPMGIFRFSQIELQIKIRAQLDHSVDHPTHEIDAEANKVLTDLKKVLSYPTTGALVLTNSTATIQYSRSARELSPAGNVYVPGVLNTFWTITYQS
jgi:hypothetical protein